MGRNFGPGRPVHLPAELQVRRESLLPVVVGQERAAQCARRLPVLVRGGETVRLHGGAAGRHQGRPVHADGVEGHEGAGRWDGSNAQRQGDCRLYVLSARERAGTVSGECEQGALKGEGNVWGFKDN